MFKKILLFAVVLLVMAGSVFGVLCQSDGQILGQEQCDDNNVISGDGCTDCLIDSGYYCTGQPSNCMIPACGDGYVNQQTEACDDGNTVSGDGCSSNCQLEATANTEPPSISLPPAPGNLNIYTGTYDLDGNMKEVFHVGEEFEVRVYVQDTENLFDASLILTLDNVNVEFLGSGKNGEIYSLPVKMEQISVGDWSYIRADETISSSNTNENKLLFSVDAKAKAKGLTKTGLGYTVFNNGINVQTSYSVNFVETTIEVKALATCSDLIKNQGESGVDCGGTTADGSTVCNPCAADKSCKVGSDCKGFCVNNLCKDIDLMLCEGISKLEPVKDKPLIQAMSNALSDVTIIPLLKLDAIVTALKIWLGVV